MASRRDITDTGMAIIRAKIVEKTCVDYYKALTTLAKSIATNDQKLRYKSIKMCRDCERFFQSDWARDLCVSTDPERLMSLIQNKARTRTAGVIKQCEIN